MKKIASVFLAAALALTFCISAFAEVSVPEIDEIGEQVSEQVSEIAENAGISLDDAKDIFDMILTQVDPEVLQKTIADSLATVGELGDFDITSLDTQKIPAFLDAVTDQLAANGVDVDALYDKLSSSELLNFFASIYIGDNVVTEPETTTEAAATEAETSPDTGSAGSRAVGGIAVLAALSLATAAAFVSGKKKA